MTINQMIQFFVLVPAAQSITDVKHDSRNKCVNYLTVTKLIKFAMVELFVLSCYFSHIFYANTVWTRKKENC